MKLILEITILSKMQWPWHFYHLECCKSILLRQAQLVQRIPSTLIKKDPLFRDYFVTIWLQNSPALCKHHCPLYNMSALETFNCYSLRQIWSTIKVLKEQHNFFVSWQKTNSYLLILIHFIILVYNWCIRY